MYSFTTIQKSAAKPLQAPQGYSSSAPYLGSNTPSSIYLGVPPYGSSLFNGSSVPPYDVPFSGGSAYHYNYGSRLSAGSPYRPLHLSGPTPYTGGPVMGNGTFCFFVSVRSLNFLQSDMLCFIFHFFLELMKEKGIGEKWIIYWKLQLSFCIGNDWFNVT